MGFRQFVVCFQSLVLFSGPAPQQLRLIIRSSVAPAAHMAPLFSGTTSPAAAMLDSLDHPPPPPIQYSVMFIHGNGVTLRTQKVIQGGDNGHVGHPCEVSPAPPCPELFCELRGLCSLFQNTRTCTRAFPTPLCGIQKLLINPECVWYPTKEGTPTPWIGTLLSRI